MENLDKTVAQLTKSVGQMQQQVFGRLPSQTENNPEISNMSMLNLENMEEVSSVFFYTNISDY